MLCKSLGLLRWTLYSLWLAQVISWPPGGTQATPVLSKSHCQQLLPETCRQLSTSFSWILPFGCCLYWTGCGGQLLSLFTRRQVNSTKGNCPREGVHRQQQDMEFWNWPLRHLEGKQLMQWGRSNTNELQKLWSILMWARRQALALPVPNTVLWAENCWVWSKKVSGIKLGSSYPGLDTQHIQAQHYQWLKFNIVLILIQTRFSTVIPSY